MYTKRIKLMVRLHCFLAMAVLFFCNTPAYPEQADITDEINNYIRSGNVKVLAPNFAPNVQLSILNDDDEVYSKAQTEIILKDFFTKHSPKSLKVVHALTSNPMYRFNVLILTTSNGIFRLSYSMKSTGGKFLITEMRIESN